MRITQSYKSHDFVRFPITLSAPGKGRHKVISYSARMDTGFNGFLAVPLTVASAVGLKSSNYVSATFGNGANHVLPACLCKVRLGRKVKEENTIILPKDDIFIGMEFLELFELKLIIDSSSSTAILTDEEIEM
jgi:predicted aspartyl protease